MKEDGDPEPTLRTMLNKAHLSDLYEYPTNFTQGIVPVRHSFFLLFPYELSSYLELRHFSFCVVRRFLYPSLWATQTRKEEEKR